VEASFVVEQYHKANPDFFGEQGPYAQLYALNSLVYSLGMTVGPLFSGILKDSIGYGNANLVLASICLVTSVLSFIYVGGTPKILTRKSGHGLDVTER
jgi:MFS family permease